MMEQAMIDWKIMRIFESKKEAFRSIQEFPHANIHYIVIENLNTADRNFLKLCFVIILDFRFVQMPGV